MRSPSPTALIVGAVVTQLAVGAALIGVTAVYWLAPPSPVTTITVEDGREVELDWADYPADPWLDPDDVLAAPRAEDVAEIGDAELVELRAAVEPAAPGLDWESQGSGTADSLLDRPVGGNGYGGRSLHRTYNAPDTVGDGLGTDAEWTAVSDALDAELSRLGYDEIVWDFDREPYVQQSRAERDAEIFEQFGSLDPDRMWVWSGWAERGSMWVAVTIWDERRGAPEDAWPESQSGISLSLGGTVVAVSDEEAYTAGVAPFDGLPRPEPTRSD